VTLTLKTFSYVAAGAVAVTLASCSRAEMEERAAQTPKPIETTLATVAETEWPSIYEAGAVVRTRQTAVVSARVVAPILEVRVTAGDRVRRGQTLVVLDGRELQAQVARAAAGASGSTLALQAAQADKRAAESALVLARLTHDRVRGLHEKDSATKAELDEATAVLAGAEARVAGATARVAEAEQGIAAANAAEEAASVGASYTVLTAPFDGIVSARHADPGTLAAPGIPLLTLDDATGYRLEARIDESHAQLVAPGAEADVRLDRAGADRQAWRRARVAEVASLDPARHSFLVKLDLPSDMPDVRSGQFGRVRLVGPARRALAVPASAVVRRGQLTLAFAIDEAGAARLRMVSVGDAEADRVEILAGLSAGDRIVLNPPANLEDGQPITGAGAKR
jgi:RND family efflux transporter MFP subunit